jgi:transcription antitermination factor NusG
MDIGTEGKSNSWYAVRVRSRFENVVARHLHARGYQLFLPLYKCQRQWSDRLREIELPLFPGYVFCQFNPVNRLPILSIPGVVHLVGVGEVPVPVDETEIAAIQTAIRSGLSARPWSFLKVGQRVRIERGPLFGVEGILVEVRGLRRLVLSISLLQRSVAVQVDAAWVIPMPQPFLRNATTRCEPFVQQPST